MYIFSIKKKGICDLEKVTLKRKTDIKYFKQTFYESVNCYGGIN